MERKNDPEKINLKITKVEIGGNPMVNKGCLSISWESDIGFGEYNIIISKQDQVEGHSETMDSNDDKRFLKKLMELLIEEITITE